MAIMAMERAFGLKIISLSHYIFLTKP